MTNQNRLIKIKVKLNPKQKRGLRNWVITIDNKEKEIPSELVEWYGNSLKDVVNSFNEDEVESFVITGPIKQKETLWENQY